MALEKQNPPYDSKIDPKVLRILHFYDSSSYPSLQLIYISWAYNFTINLYLLSL